jgi:iron complex outermembrane recepter protein
MLKTSMIRSALAALACSLSFTTHAIADAPKRIDVPAGELIAALETLSRQAAVDLVFQPDQLKSFRTEGVRGTYSPQDAIRILLQGKPLQLHTDASSGAMVIAPAAAPKSAPVTGGRAEEPKGFWSRFRLARSNTPSPDPAPANTEKEAAVEGYEPRAGRGIPEILVEGSRSLNADIERTRDDIQPYVVLDREAIAKSGARNVDEFLKYKLTMATSAPSQSQLGGTQALNGNTSSINLRGLGKNQTLILIDGHRAASLAFGGGPNQPDLNGIPLSAIERIEVLPATASGIYGGGATGGVINVVLRRDYAGVETKLTYENAFEQDVPNRQVDLSAGFSLEGGRTDVLFAGSYSDADALLMEDRGFFARGRAHVLANNPAAIFSAQNPPLGATVNIRSSTGANLTLKNGGGALNSPFTYVPRGYTGPASDNGAALRENAGQYNHELANTAQGLGGGRVGLLNAPTVKSGMLTIRREMTSSLQAFLDLSASSNESFFLDNAATSTFLIPNTAPINPFNQPVRVTLPAFGADGTIETMIQNRKAVGGVIAKLPGDWTAAADYTWNRTRLSRARPGVLDATAAGAALSNGTINAFRDPNTFAVDFSPYLFGDSVSTAPVHTTLENAALRFSGPVGSLPAGRPTLATLVEYRQESFDDFFNVTQTAAAPSTLFLPSRSQKVESVYLEATLPIVSEINRIPGVQLLELQLAGRHDEYETNGANAINIVNGVPSAPVTRSRNRLSSTDPTAGLRYQPVPGVTFRASWGTGFLPPAVNQLVPGSTPTTSVLTDPRRGNAALGGVTLTTGGDPDLRPEESESRSLGLILQPAFAPGLRFSVDWIQIDKTDNIRNLSLNQENLNLELLVPGLVTRADPAPNDPFGVGRITGYSTQLRNISRVEVEAYDFALSYETGPTRAGAFNFSLGGTKMAHFLTMLTPLTPTAEMAGVSGAFGDEGGLNWKLSSILEWELRQMSLAWSTMYFDSYYLMSDHSVVPSQGSATVPSQIYHDLIGTYRFDLGAATALARLASSTQVAVGVRNLFNKEPPVEATSTVGALYSNWGDPRLRSYFVSLNVAF